MNAPLIPMLPLPEVHSTKDIREWIEENAECLFPASVDPDALRQVIGEPIWNEAVAQVRAYWQNRQPELTEKMVAVLVAAFIRAHMTTAARLVFPDRPAQSIGHTSAAEIVMTDETPLCRVCSQNMSVVSALQIPPYYVHWMCSYCKAYTVITRPTGRHDGRP